nr:MAG TPA: hypothetical protein [Bacteriophage sp.]
MVERNDVYIVNVGQNFTVINIVFLIHVFYEQTEIVVFVFDFQSNILRGF